MRAPRNLPFLLKVYFIAGSIVLVTLALYYNSSLIRRMREQSESTTQLFSKFIAIGLRDIRDINRREFINRAGTWCLAGCAAAGTGYLLSGCGAGE